MFKKSVTTCPKRQCHIPKDLNLQHHRCESLRSRMNCGKLKGEEKIDYGGAGSLRLDLEPRLYILFLRKLTVRQKICCRPFNNAQ